MMMTKTELRDELALCVAEATASSNTHATWVLLDILDATYELLSKRQLASLIEHVNDIKVRSPR